MTDVLWCLITAIAIDFVWWLLRVLLDQRRQHLEESQQYAAQMDGIAYGGGLDERDRREALRRRLRLDS